MRGQSQGARISASRFNQAHAEKTMQSRMISPDRLSGREPAAQAGPKQTTTLRLDPDVIEYFRKDGPGWQTRIGEVLRRAVKRSVR
jgi:uncharacterized protein (DUF4415 family)